MPTDERDTYEACLVAVNTGITSPPCVITGKYVAACFDLFSQIDFLFNLGKDKRNIIGKLTTSRLLF